MNRKQLIKKYISYFKSKKHKEIPNASLIPMNDPTILFTTAGMHPLVPYLSGQKHPLGKRLVNVQKCIRTGDIEEVGDTTHHTFFEMLGNWSLGDYWKQEAIGYSYEFLTKELGLDKSKISITCFKGDKDAPKDIESAKIWEDTKIPKSKIKFLGKKDNWWGPAGKTGPCGPDTEIFYNNIEIWNNVFMQYHKNESGYNPAKQKNVDTGMGVERTLAVLNNLDDNYLTDAWKPIIKEIEKISGKTYGKNKGNTKAMRIIADHVKASVFIINEKVTPSNKEQGYVLRRLIRRTIRYGKLMGLKDFTTKIAKPVFEIYKDCKFNKKIILKELQKEEDKFNITLEKGLNFMKKEFFNKAIGNIDPENPPKGMVIEGNKLRIKGEKVFYFYQSFGFPLELTQEIMKDWGVEFDEQTMKEAQVEFEKHQALSRTATKGKFSSGLADNSEQTKKLHTATHLLNAALQKTLTPKPKQRGSNITPERLRFDFNFPRKLTEKEISDVESLVNKKIKARLQVIREEMPLKKAQDSGAQAEFGHKYPNKVSVYTIKEKSGFFSKEICTGPHVSNTKEIGTFKITKEQSSAAGIRRIKAIIK